MNIGIKKSQQYEQMLYGEVNNMNTCYIRKVTILTCAIWVSQKYEHIHAVYEKQENMNIGLDESQ